MSARYLLALFDSVYVIALCAWVGSILFFSFGVAPLIFRVLGQESGAKFVRALFPRYYAWGAIAGAIALPAYVAVPLCYPEYRGPWIGVQAMILLGCILVMLYAGNSLTPAINAARDAGPSEHERFERLHRRSVGLNALVLVVGLGLLAAFANRPAPRTSGLAELSPADRGRFDVELDRAIEEIETKYGYRRPRPGQAADAGGQGPALPAEMIREIDTYYAQKRQRDLERGRPVPQPGPLPAPPARTSADDREPRPSGGR
ncbi:MAG: DUF4149 domain-containing protein [Isosphaeraceae bacterium]